eukprot:scpid90550/ scgid7069/ 
MIQSPVLHARLSHQCRCVTLASLSPELTFCNAHSQALDAFSLTGCVHTLYARKKMKAPAACKHAPLAVRISKDGHHFYKVLLGICMCFVCKFKLATNCVTKIASTPIHAAGNFCMR